MSLGVVRFFRCLTNNQNLPENSDHCPSLPQKEVESPPPSSLNYPPPPWLI
ncbi:MAG: hypothetical protein RML10_04045 [Geminocystis sp.]|nr:hypothetical protein [Geminocystis sp.]